MDGIIVNVNRTELLNAASKVDTYISDLKTKMSYENAKVLALGSSWEGKDYTAFKAQFSKADDPDSVYANMLKALERHAEILRFAEGKYKQAQIDAVNRAQALVR